MIGIIGSSGFLGMNLCEFFDEKGISYIRGNRNFGNNSHVDARDASSVCNWIKLNKISKIINLAAVCGGIGLNSKSPFDLWHSTTLITASVLKASIDMRIDKLVMLGTVCSYAAECPTPFKEEYLMNFGFPEPTNRAYGVSKLNGLIGSQAAFSQYNLDSINIIPVNMYGPYDHFNLDNSHVIPALINKIVNAKDNSINEVVVWGTGKASREFLYARDCCDAIYKSLNIKSDEFINIGSGKEITIKDLVNKICSKLNYDGTIIWDHSKPDGQIRRNLDINAAERILGWKPVTDFDTGLDNTISWYLKWRHNASIIS